MEKVSKELLRDFVKSQHFTSTTDILNSMKELFSDVLQQVIEDHIYDERCFVFNSAQSVKHKDQLNIEFTCKRRFL